MTGALAPPPYLLTVDAYLALGEPPWGYTELVEGRLVTTPSADRHHNTATLAAAFQLDPQLPPDTRRGKGLIRAADVVIVFEFVSPGSVRTDHMVKRSEYADAGIPHYWIVDLRDRPSLIACHAGGDFGYVDGGVTHGVFTTTDPFPLRLDLDALR